MGFFRLISLGIGVFFLIGSMMGDRFKTIQFIELIIGLIFCFFSLWRRAKASDKS